MAVNMSSALGVSFNDTSTTAQFALGTTVDGPYNQKWMYVQAGSAITAFDTVSITTAGSAVPITKALVDAAIGHVGFAQNAFTSTYFGWVAIEGSNIQLRGAASCAAGVALYTTATAGVLDDEATSQTQVLGVYLTAAVGAGGTAAATAIATAPRMKS